MSLFPTEEEQREEIRQAEAKKPHLSSHDDQAPQDLQNHLVSSKEKNNAGPTLSKEQIDEILLGDEGLNCRYKIYKTLAQEKNGKETMKLLRDSHKAQTKKSKDLVIKDKYGNERHGMIYSTDGGLEITVDYKYSGPEYSVSIGWGQLRREILRLMYEGKFITEDEIALREGNYEPKGLPEIPQGEIDRALMPDYGEHFRKPVLEIVSQNRRDDDALALFKENTGFYNAKAKYEYTDGTIGRVAADDEGVYLEKQGCEPAFVSWEQAYDRVAEICKDSANDFYIENYKRLTSDYIDSLISRGPALAGSKVIINTYFSQESGRSDEEKDKFLAGAYGAPFRDWLPCAQDINTKAGWTEADEYSLNFLLYRDYTAPGEFPNEDISLSWTEVRKRVERLVSSGLYMTNDGPENIYDRKEGQITQSDLESILMKGTGFVGDKNRIAAAYESGSRQEFIDAILREYTDLDMYFHVPDDKGSYTFYAMRARKDGGLYYKKAIAPNISSVEHSYTFDIEKIADTIGGMIDRDEYLTPDEKRLSPEEIARERAISEEEIKTIFLDRNIQTRMAIYQVIQDGGSNHVVEKVIRRQLGWSGGNTMYNGFINGFHDFNPNGVKLQKAELEATLSFADVRKVITTLIAEGRFVTEAELAAAEEERAKRYLSDEDVERETAPVEETRPEYDNEFEENIMSSAENYRIMDDDIGAGTPKVRLGQNIDAINILKDIESAGRAASAKEQELLAGYVGWGGLAGAFDEREDSSTAKELKELLTDAEYRSARASTLTAYYTPPIVARSVYAALERMGFAGGNILEPSLGIGHFFGVMPEEMAKNSQLYGVELDSLSGRIAKQLYPKADIKICGYEKADYPDSFFDIAVGNIPFGQLKVVDMRYDKLNMPIHDYFIAKTLDKVRPGGVIAFVTSRYTLDKENPVGRRYFAQRAELLGAVRLPNTTLKAAAGTEVTADIIFLQKRERMIDVEPDWIFTGKNEDGIVMNEYFVKHPEMILGRMELQSGPWGMEPACLPLEEKDLANQLAEATGRIEGQIPELGTILDENDERQPEESIPADPSVRNFSYTVIEGNIYYRENSRMYPRELSAEAASRIKMMIVMRDTARDLINCQLGDGSDADILRLQRELRAGYDLFVKRHGIINSRVNAQAMKGDSGYYLLCSLEILDDERKHVVRLADMFTKRTIRRRETPVQAHTAEEALTISIAERGRVDMDYMLALLGGKNEEEVGKMLAGLIYRDPIETLKAGRNVYLPADEYLSGDIVKKLETAKLAENSHPGEYIANITALSSVLPEKIPAVDIGVHLGSTWVDPHYIQQFIVELLEPSPAMRDNMKVLYLPHIASWSITNKNMDRNNVKAAVTYGTKEVDAYKLIEDSLNGKYTTVFRTEKVDGKEVRVLDKLATTEAQKQQEVIKAKFKDWIFADPGRREKLVEKYNRLFNTSRPRVYDGSHIAFAGMNPEIKLNKHQRDATARILYGPNTLLGHVVGAGKTFEMVAATMEGKRIGVANKSLYVVPNHLTVQTAAEFMRLYPAANLLVATVRDFEAKNRKTFCSRIATGDYDAVILGYSQFEKIPLSDERQIKYLEVQREDIIDGIINLQNSDAPRYSVKRMEKIRDNIDTKLKLIREHLDARKDDVITFEELGVDRLFVDEAHYFKNLMTITKMHNIAGVSTSESQKSMDLYLKCRYMDEITGGRGITFATGTPISNSMVEMYTMQRYLQMDRLQEKGIAHFDAWASTFGETVLSIELAPEGTGFRGRTRFAKFTNLPDLMRMFGEVADIKVAEDLNLPVPKVNYINVSVPPSDEQLAMIAELSARAERVRNGAVSSDVDNMLLITSDGRKIGLDQRLMDPSLPDNPGSKVNACIENVRRIWEEGKVARTTQLIFCDFSTPDKDRFNLYYDVKEKLVAAGVPEEEIVFIHSAKSEAQKAALFAKVRAGSVRILMGSTVKMGAGTNVQDRLIASHDLDCPWRPSDLEQRAGRIVRQGNSNAEVKVYRYVTERTFDAYLYQTIENKQKFISQIMTNKSPLRSSADIDESVLQYAEVKALCAGDPRIKEKMELDIDVTRLKMLKAAYQSNRYDMEDKVSHLPHKIAEAKENIALLKADVKHLEDNTRLNNENKFSPMDICEKICTTRKSAGESLLLAKELARGGQSQHLGRYRGFEMYMSYQVFGGEYYVTLQRQREGKDCTQHHVTMGSDVIGNTMRIDNALNGIAMMVELAENELSEMEKQLKEYAVELKKPFALEEELEIKSARLADLDIQINLDGKGERQDEMKTAGVEVTASREATHAAERLTPTPIEDFGEKLGGARKDVMAVSRQAMERLLPDGEIASKPLSETFPTPDYAKLLEAGMDEEAVALIHAVRDAIPPKPQKSGFRLNRYVGAVKTAREVTEMMLSSSENSASTQAVLSKLKSSSLGNGDEVVAKATLYRHLGHERSLKDYYLKFSTFTSIDGQEFDPPVSRLCLRENKSLRLAAIGESLADVANDFKRRNAEIGKGGRQTQKTTKFVIYHYRTKPGYFIGKKIGRDYLDLAGPLERLDEARAYVRENSALLEERLEKFKMTPSERREENAARVGVELRGGLDVTPEMFAEAFGFRGVEFGNWVEQDKRQKDLNEAYDALMDLAGVIGVPPKAISLNGELGLAFGSRGKGGKNPPKAHYEQGRGVINLTKERGAGSLAHEWMHAVDNYFAALSGRKDEMASALPQVNAAARGLGVRELSGVRPEMVAAFGEIRRAIVASGLVARGKVLDMRRTKPYWTLETELQSRAFEGYIVDKLADSGASNDYLANIAGEDYWRVQNALLGKEQSDDFPYPKREEMPEIRAAFDSFFSTLKTRETDKGIQMYSLSAEEDRGLPPISVAEVAARVKGAKVTDLGRGRMSLSFSSGVTWLVDTQAQEIPVDPEIIRRDYGRDVRPEDVVGGRTRIIGGRRFIDLVDGMSSPKTFSHEMFEASWDLLDKDEQKTLLTAYKSREAAADRYSAFLEGRVMNNSKATVTFQRIKDIFMDIRASLFGKNSEDIFRQVADGTVAVRDQAGFDQVSAPGRLLYLNQKRFSQWLSLPELQLLGGQSIERSTKTLLQSEHNVNSNERIIKTESDLAKAKGAKVPEKAEVEKNLSQMIDAEKVMEKPPHEWSSADEDAVLKEIDRILAIDRALSHQLKVALDAAPPGSKGEVAENFFAANDKMKPEQERVKRYLLKLKERQELYAETGKEEENRNIGDVDVVMNKGPRRQQMSALMNEGGIIMEKDSVRKTVDIVGKDEIIHYYDKRNKPILGRIIENDSYQVFTSETKSNDITTYHASFYVADKAKGEDGKFPGDARRYCVRVSSTKPFDLSEYRNGEKPIYISGQRFEMTSEKTGKVRDVIIARSITEAERQNDGIWRGVKPIVAKEDSLKNEYQSAAKEVLSGYVYQGKYSQFNKPIMNKENVVISYAQRFTVCAEKWEQGKPVIGENGKRVYELMSVQMYTKEPIEYEKLLSFKDGEKNRITMKGAVHVYDFLNKKNELVKDNKDFEPSWIGAYEKAKDKSLDNKCLEAEEPEL